MTGDSVNLSQLAAEFRELVQHEDELTHQRMSWFLTIEGLLFAALAFGWEKSAVLVCAVLAPAGVAACVSCRSTLVKGPAAVKRLVSEWDRTLASWGAAAPGQNRPDIIGARFDVAPLRQFLWPWNSLPWALGITWVAAAILRPISG